MTGEATGRFRPARALAGLGQRRRPAGQIEVLVDPSMTDVWHRRVVAAVVDLALVIGVFTSLTLLQVERLTRDASGLFTPLDMDRYNALRAMPNRHLVLGETTYVLAGAELVMTVVLTLATLLGVYVLLPGYTGRSPGKALTGLRVLTVHGDVVGLSHTIIRFVIGVVDVLPVVPPGALGARFARRSPLRQRLGDRAAATVVVDGRRPLAVVAAPSCAGAPLLAPVSRPGDDHAPAASSERIGSTAQAALLDSAAKGHAVAPAAGTVDARPGDAPAAVDRASGGRRREGPPLPQHRGAADGGGDGASTPTAGPAVGAHTASAPSAGAATTDATGWLGDLATVLAPEHHERPASTTAATEPARPRRSPRPARAADGSRHPAEGEAPVWNDDWQAWLYYDAEQGAWHRHEPETGAWLPIG